MSTVTDGRQKRRKRQQQNQPTRQQIIDAINFQDFYVSELGFRTTGKVFPSGYLDGWSLFREERNPSAGIDTKTGHYSDRGPGGESLSFFDTVQRKLGLPDIGAAMRYCAEYAGLISAGSSPKPARTDSSTSDGKNRQKRERKQTSLQQVASYTYRDADGNILFQKNRCAVTYDDGSTEKTFRQSRYDVQSRKFVSGLKGVPRPLPLYRLPELMKSEGAIVYLCEGEKDADRLALIGLTATTNFQGAGAWDDSYSDVLSGRDVVILVDNDEAGEDHANLVAKSLHGKAARVRAVRLPGLPPKGDVSDWLDLGHTVEELQREVAKAPDWQPEPISGARGVVTNCRPSEGENGKSQPLSMSEIISDIDSLTGKAVKRTGSRLFVHREGHRIDYIRSADALFGYLGSITDQPPHFCRSENFHTKGEVYQQLHNEVENFKAIEHAPHNPRMSGHYYTCEFPPHGNGDALRGLVNRFNPSTSVDWDLIEAFFVTLFWGGPGGTRPAFLITADAGRGVGKTTLATMGGYLVGGHIDCGGIISLSSREDITKTKERLLSPEGREKRIALLDNVKSRRFSSESLEDLITAATISGKELYVGDASRPNLLTFVITLNGASLSKDMAQRCVIIKLDKPSHTGDWAQQTRDYIDEHRQAIIGDCLGFFDREPMRLTRFSRWAEWDREILSRLSEPGEVQTVVQERQAVTDVETEESQIIEEEFETRLSELGYSTATDRVFVPSYIACEWYLAATNEKVSKSLFGRIINAKIDAGELPRLAKPTSNHQGRGVVWQPDGCSLDEKPNGDLETRWKRQNREGF